MKSRVAFGLLALVLIAGFSLLGRWQLQRAEHKEAMLASVAEAMAGRDPEPLTMALDGDEGYAWVQARGRFLPLPALLLDNQRRGAAVGVRVFAPFQPEAGPVFLVDLGWLPLPADRQLPAVESPAGVQTVAGLLAPAPTGGLALGPPYVKSDNRRWLMTRVDLSALSPALGVPLAARVLRLDPASPLGYARDLDVLPNTLPPERHRGYALQWFGLAFATLVGFLYLTFFRWPRP